MAEDLWLLTEGDLVPLVPTTEYSFDYNTAAKEIRAQTERGYCPELKDPLPDLSGHDLVFVGSPNWFHTLAPPVLTFLRKAPLGRCRLAPFMTHGGGGLGSFAEDLRRECPTHEVVSPRAFAAGSGLDEVRAWLADLALPGLALQ